jgi:hypothetical protein
MSKVIIKGLGRQLKLEVPQQLVHEVIQPQKQPRCQVKGVQLVEPLNNELQQPVMVEVLFH